MTDNITVRLNAAGITLPAVAAPAGNYSPYVLNGSQLLISGQLPFWNGTLKYVGSIGDTLTVADGQDAARICGLNIIAQAQAALGGDLGRVRRCLRLGGYVRGVPGFDQQAQVLNGASDLMAAVFAAAGKHVRIAVGVTDLPLGAAVEVDALFDVA